jgi:4-amino-4-deoxy-L-arabinose transferase-like glycosyltransferase
MTRSTKILLFAQFAILCYFPIFLHLDSESLYHWDEARNGLNALEMAQNGNPLVRFYQGKPETWETKPPLLIWFQVLFFKIVGFNELAIRLPSALAAIFTVFVMLRFFIKELKDPIAGFFAGLVLVCTQGFIDFHIVRTGDHDALLAFFQTVIVIYSFKFLITKPFQNRYLTITTVALILSVLTKSIMGFAMLPGIFIYTILKKQTIPLLKLRNLWFAIFGFVITIGGYYLLREQLQPGYLKLVWENELFPRYFNVAEGHNYSIPKSRFYYLQLIVEKQFSYFVYFFPIFLGSIFLSKNKKVKAFAIYLIICAVVFLVLISGGTVNSWYDAPVFPLLAMLAGLGLSAFLNSLIQYFDLKSEWKKGFLTATVFIAFFSYPYFKIIDKVYQPNNNRDKYGQFLERLSEREQLPDNLFVFYKWRNSSFLFYEKVYNEFKGLEIESCGVRGNFQSCESLPSLNQKVMICDQKFIKEFEGNYEFEVLQQMDNCFLYEVGGFKK